MTAPEIDAALTKARAGDRQAFAALYRMLAEPLFAYLLTRTRRREDAEDVLGQVFLEAMHAIDGFDGDLEGFRAWLYRIARNRAVDAGRRIERRAEDSLDAAYDEAGQESAESQALSRLEQERVWKAVGALPDAQREVITLRLASGLSSAEIAEVLGKGINAVKALQHRALANLARSLGAPGPANQTLYE